MLQAYNFKVIDKKIITLKEMSQKVEEAGGDIKVSLKQRLSRAFKFRGGWHVFKQALAYPGHLILNKIFKTYPDTIMLCQKC